MFIYENIPDVKITDIIHNIRPIYYSRMPQTLREFCKAVDADPNFYANHSHIYIGSVALRRMHDQIYGYLERHAAVEYSIEDELANACISKPLGITFWAQGKSAYGNSCKIKDIAELYQLSSGKLWLPPHHQAKVTELGKVPETVAVILRDYIRYVLKCKDKDFDELQKELITLSNAGVLTVDYYNLISAEVNAYKEAMQNYQSNKNAKQNQ